LTKLFPTDIIDKKLFMLSFFPEMSLQQYIKAILVSASSFLFIQCRHTGLPDGDP